MVEMPIKLAVIWICVMLTYLLGDVLRIFSGDAASGKTGFMQFTQGMWLVAAILMVVPIVMIFLSITLNQPVNRWVNIIFAAFSLLFNLVGLPTYPSMYDKFLLVVSMVFNGLTIWYAWNWA